jgi:hypothetical protein
MARPVQPLTYRCMACDWSRTVAPRSDALMPWDTVSRCGACGSDNLRTEQPTALSGAVASGLQALERLLRR